MEQHVALATEIPGRKATGALGARDLFGQALALGNERQQFGIQFRQPLAQPGQFHAAVPS